MSAALGTEEYEAELEAKRVALQAARKWLIQEAQRPDHVAPIARNVLNCLQDFTRPSDTAVLWLEGLAAKRCD